MLHDKSKNTVPPVQVVGNSASWSDRYGEKHRFRRITNLPLGIHPLRRIRIYQRADALLLQWWDPNVKRNLSVRVEGDLVAAIMRARQIEERLDNFKSSGQGHRRIPHQKVVEQFMGDLHRRADAGEIDPRTAVRYESALSHYLIFVEQAPIQAAFPSTANVNREFALKFAAYLANLRISPNGHPQTARRRMVAPKYVEDVVRAMLSWAADPERGCLMPEGFRNPFAGPRRRSTETARDLFGEPDVTLEMAAQFLETCDAFQLPLFALIAFYGLRPSELCFLFRENLADDWLKVQCLPGLAYHSKGRRDKRLPLIEPLQKLLLPQPGAPTQGLLFLRRKIWDGSERPQLWGAGLNQLEREFEDRCRSKSGLSARERVKRRETVFRDAGAITYDHIEHEFGRIARSLGWPAEATIKDFRHLFSTSLENAGMPIFTRRYLLGQAPGKSPIVSYTHINELRRHYEEAIFRTLEPLVNAIVRRSRQPARH